jgi:hypothetical protein
MADVTLAVQPVTAVQAVDGMRRHFGATFGRGWVSRRLARAAWTSFRVALLHGSGVHVAASHARLAAEERNERLPLVARWSRGSVS